MSMLVLKVGGRVGHIEGALAALPSLISPGHETVPAPALPPNHDAPANAGTPPHAPNRHAHPRSHGVCIVHGGGPEVSRWMERLALPVHFKDGLRVTDAAALEVATLVLRGAVSTSLAQSLASLGVRAVGLSGVDGGLVEAAPHPDPLLGAVGEVGAVHPEILHAIIGLGMVPLVAPLALDGAGTLRNINGDTLCGAIAGALGADLAVFLTDVPGVLDEQGAVIDHLRAADAERLIAAGAIRGGMIPKVRACLAALRRGARAVCIADGRSPTVLPALVAHSPGVGTVIEE